MVHKRYDSNGFTLIELMVVVAIIAFLSLIAVPVFTNFLNKAKRTEVYLNLGALHTAEKLFWAEHGHYSPVLTGADGIGWRPEGEPLYTYGFAGAEGINFVTGKLKGPGSALAPYAKADQHGFTVVAVADIDGDGKLDIVTMDEGRQIKIVQDDCAT